MVLINFRNLEDEKNSLVIDSYFDSIIIRRLRKDSSFILDLIDNYSQDIEYFLAELFEYCPSCLAKSLDESSFEQERYLEKFIGLTLVQANKRRNGSAVSYFVKRYKAMNLSEKKYFNLAIYFLVERYNCVDFLTLCFDNGLPIDEVFNGKSHIKRLFDNYYRSEIDLISDMKDSRRILYK